MSQPASHDHEHDDDLPDQLEGERLDKNPEPGELPSDTDVQAERPEGHVEP